MNFPLRPFSSYLTNARNKRKQCVIRTASNVISGFEFGSALADENRAALDCFAANRFTPSRLRVRVSSISRAANSFFCVP
jgi:hypothetical protein